MRFKAADGSREAVDGSRWAVDGSRGAVEGSRLQEQLYTIQVEGDSKKTCPRHFYKVFE